MSKLKLVAGVIIAGMWIFKEELAFIGVLTFVAAVLALVGGMLCLAN